MSDLALKIIGAVFSVDAGSAGIPKAEINQAQVSSVAGGAFMIAGMLSVIFIIVGGLRYTLSQGSADETKRAKNTILYAVVGLVVSIFAFGIVQLFTFKIF